MTCESIIERWQKDLTNECDQVPAEAYSWIPCHGTHDCNNGPGCENAAELHWNSILWQVCQLTEVDHVYVYCNMLFEANGHKRETLMQHSVAVLLIRNWSTRRRPLQLPAKGFKISTS